jgi:hypothetical protein
MAQSLISMREAESKVPLKLKFDVKVFNSLIYERTYQTLLEPGMNRKESLS